MLIIRINLAVVLATVAHAQTQTAPGSTIEIRKPDRTVQTGKLNSLSYSPNGNLLAAAGDDGTVRIWDAKTGKLTQTIGPLSRAISSVSFSPDGKIIAAATLDGAIHIVNAATGNLERAITAVGMRGLAFQPGTLPFLVTSSQTGLAFWNFATGQRQRSAPGALSEVVFRPDGKWLATIVEGKSIQVWEAGSRDFLANIRTLDAGSEVASVAMSATAVAAGGPDGTLRIWPNDGPAREWTAHRSAIRKIGFFYDGQQLASAGLDGVIKVWDVKSGVQLASLEGHSGEVSALAFSLAGRQFASTGADRTIRYWTQPPPPIPAEEIRKIEAAIPARATAVPKKPRKLLVFWRGGHRIGEPYVNAMLELLARKTGAFEVHYRREYEVFDPKVLSQYDAIVMNSTAHLAFSEESQKQALLDYARGGGGIIGIHAAIDTFKDWPEGAQIIGATFGGEPWVPAGRWAVKVEDPEHPLTRAFQGKTFRIHDEFYEMDTPYTRADRRVLLSLDMSDPATGTVLPIHRKDGDFAVAWIKKYGEGRVFYAQFGGHSGEPVQTPAVVQFYLDGIQYVLGDLEAN